MEKNWNSAYMVKAFARLPFDVMLQQRSTLFTATVPGGSISTGAPVVVLSALS